MVERLAASIVENDALAVQSRDEDRGSRRENKGPVRRREYVNHVLVPKPAQQKPQVLDGRDDGTHVLHPLQRAQRSRKTRVVRNERDVERWIGAQPLHQSLRDHRLSTENVERWSDDTYAEPRPLLPRHCRRAAKAPRLGVGCGGRH
jgi:hypothetical protein